MRARGYTLIECMIAVAIIGIAWAILPAAFDQYQRASDRTYRIEGLARLLDVEMERFRACGDGACVRGLATKTATTAGVSLEASSWIRARVRRTVTPGPDGTFEVALEAQADGVPPQRLAGLVWVPR